MKPSSLGATIGKARSRGFARELLHQERGQALSARSGLGAEPHESIWTRATALDLAPNFNPKSKGNIKIERKHP